MKYKNHRFPVEIISHAVWLYFRFCLSFRGVEELLFKRGVIVTYEAIRKWCHKFGRRAVCFSTPSPASAAGDRWHPMKWSSLLRANVTICGEQSIGTAHLARFGEGIRANKLTGPT
jgi:transposase-like protein